jgi:glycosyltransferase involved in cell wall biosynthesis
VKILKKEKPDLINSFDPKVSLNAYNLGKRLHIPVVITLTGVTWDTPVPYTFKGHKINLPAGSTKGYEKICLSVSCGLMAHEDGTGASKVSKEFASKEVPTFYSPADELILNPALYSKTAERRKFGIDKESVVFCNLSRIMPHKGIMGILEAFLTLDPYKGTLVLAGRFEDPKYGEELSKMARDNHVQFLGDVPHSDIPNLLAASDYIVMNSDMSNLTVVLSEALMMGKTVLVRDKGIGIRDFVKDNAYVFKEGELAGLMKKAIEGELPLKPAKKVRAWAKKVFSMKLIAKQLMAYYKQEGV